MNDKDNKITIKKNLIDISDEEHSDSENLENVNSNNLSESEDSLDPSKITSINLDLIKENLEIDSAEDFDELVSSDKFDDSSISNSSESSDDTNEIMLIQRENTDAEDKEIDKFIKYCIKERLFDNTFYDYGNAFSIIATKLPVTFEMISDDGSNIEKNEFIRFFTEDFIYSGDIEYIYKKIDENNNMIITWDEFIDFYLPYIKYITL